jgi:N-acetylneuraminic acid mutarotase
MRDCFYLIGGRKKNSGSTSDLYASVFQFDIARSEWKEKRPLPYALSAGTGAATGNRFIYLFGGDAGETFHKTEELIAAINKETDPVKKQTLNQQKIALQSAHPGFCRQVFLYDTRKDSWKEAGCIPFPAPVTTVAVKWGNKILIPCGEVRAGVRTGEIVVSSEMSNEW